MTVRLVVALVLAMLGAAACGGAERTDNSATPQPQPAPESLAMGEAILQHMSAAPSAGENVKISGFGTFLLRDKGERIGRNPKTGVEVPITPRRVMTFRASQTMRARVAGK